MNKLPVGAVKSPLSVNNKPPLLNRFRSLGPGMVYILTVLGTGDIVSNSAAGAGYGYRLIWALALTLVFRFVWVNTSAKYVLVTGESLLTGYQRLGNWVIWVVLIALIATRHFYNLFLILMVGNAVDLLLPMNTVWSTAIWALLFTSIGFGMMFWGGYPLIETFCRTLVAVMGASFVIAACLSQPDPAAILHGTLVPTLPQAQGLYSSMFLIMALIGTEAGSMTNLSYAYFIYEKGWKDLSFLQRQRFDLATGVICMFIMGALLQIAAAGTLYNTGIDVEGAEDLVEIFARTQGTLGLVVFGLGLWGATFSTFVGGNTGGALIVTDICRNLLSRQKSAGRDTRKWSTRKDPVYRWSLVFWCVSPLYILFTGVRPVWLVLFVSSMVVILIPILALSLLKITNDRELMGEHRNNWVTNLFLTILVGVAIYFTYRNVVEVWDSF